MLQRINNLIVRIVHLIAFQTSIIFAVYLTQNVTKSVVSIHNFNLIYVKNVFNVLLCT
jgi:hypothetical protein